MPKKKRKHRRSPGKIARDSFSVPDHRSEETILADLEMVCTEPGFAHTLAFLCWRENIIGYYGELSPDDLAQMADPNRLLRSEVALLTRLMCSEKIDFSMPTLVTIQSQIDRTEKLLEELHSTLNIPFFHMLMDTCVSDGKAASLEASTRYREPIFYSGEAAFDFQYRDFAVERYRKDETWLLDNTGFLPTDVARIHDCVQTQIIQRILDLKKSTTLENIDSLTLLPAFNFSFDHLCRESGVPMDRVKAVIKAFSMQDASRAPPYRNIGSWNCLTTHPIVMTGATSFALFQPYSLVESLYDSPIFWMRQDKGYKKFAEQHRGEFTEDFSTRRLAAVFGNEKVYQNVTAYDSKGKTVGEIDTLVLYADRAIILQAKSKKLTETARQEAGDALKADLKKAVHEAYDQGFMCAQQLLDGKLTFRTPASEISIYEHEISEVYLMCITSEFFPGLPAYGYEFIEVKNHEKIKTPYIIDVFYLDVLCEILDSPLYFLSFIDRRTHFAEQIISSSEAAILGFHVSQNLWVNENVNAIAIGEDFSAQVDTVMLSRRTNVAAALLPEGILTHHRGTVFGNLINQISQNSDGKIINLGFALLAASGESANQISEGIQTLYQRARTDGRTHDFTIGFGDTGLTVHCGFETIENKQERIHAHCELAKYRSQADQWYGLSLSPVQLGQIEVVLGLDTPWEHNDKMEALVGALPTKKRSGSVAQAKEASQLRRKIGVNEPCPCGSGKKFKKCCRSKGYFQ